MSDMTSSQRAPHRLAGLVDRFFAKTPRSAFVWGLAVSLALGWTTTLFLRPLSEVGNLYDGHWSLAANLIRGHGFKFELGGAPVLHRPPLMPVVFSPLTLLPGPLERPALVVLQGLMVGATCALLFDLIARLAGRRAARWAVAILLLYPWMCLHVNYPFTVLAQMLSTALLVNLIARAFGEAAGRQANRSPNVTISALLIGITGAAAVLTHGTMICFVVLSLAGMAGMGLLVRRPRLAGVAVMAGCLTGMLVSPWTYRNWTLSHRFIPVVTNAGFAYFYGIAHWELGGSATAPDEVAHALKMVGIDRPHEEIMHRWGFKDPALDAMVDRKMAEHMKAHPLAAARKAALNAAEYYLPSVHDLVKRRTCRTGRDKIQRIERAALSAWHLALLTAAAVGLWRRRRTPLFLPASGLACAIVLLAFPYFPFLVYVPHSHYVLATLPLLAGIIGATLATDRMDPSGTPAPAAAAPQPHMRPFQPASHTASQNEMPVHCWSVLAFVSLGIGFGLLLGLTESVLCAVEHRFHLSNLALVRPHYEWVPSTVYVGMFGSLGLLSGLAVRPLPDKWKWAVGVRGGLLLLATIYFFAIVDQLDGIVRIGIGNLSELLLAFGLASVICPLLARHSRGFLRGVRCAATVLTVAVLGWTAVTYAPQAWQRRHTLAQPTSLPAGSPNVVLIVWDTVRAENLSLYGYGRRTTPTLERLAGSSTVFDNAIASAPWTLPSHAGMFTGYPAHQFPEIETRGVPERFTTLAETLQKRGYFTAGFAANTAFCHRHTGLAQGFLHYEDSPQKFRNLVRQTRLVSRVWEDLLRPLVVKHGAVVARNGAAARINEAFLKWREGSPNKPFFAFLNYIDAHAPYHPSGRFRDEYGPTSAADWEVLTNWSLLLDKPETITPQQSRMAERAYDGCIAYLDQQLDLLLASLEKRGDLDNTLLIVTSDHGEEFGEHGVYLHPTSLYQQQTRVPLLIRYPGSIPTGRRIEEAVSLCDLPATVLDFLKTTDEMMPGESLARFWNERGGNDGELAAMTVLSELDPIDGLPLPANSQAAKGPARAVWSGGKKYIRRDREPVEELYDLDRDPLEQDNLANAEPGPVLQDLRKQVARMCPVDGANRPPAATASRRAAPASTQPRVR